MLACDVRPAWRGNSDIDDIGGVLPDASSVPVYPYARRAPATESDDNHGAKLVGIKKARSVGKDADPPAELRVSVRHFISSAVAELFQISSSRSINPGQQALGPFRRSWSSKATGTIGAD